MDKAKLKPYPFCGSTDTFTFTCSSAYSDEQDTAFDAITARQKGRKHQAKIWR